MLDDRNKIGAVVATAMSVTIIVGAGLLTLPGLTFAQAGRLGYLPWLIVSLLMIPLLMIFTYFAREFPSAGGIVGYVRASLGNHLATSAELIVLGTITLGIPAIALIGAGYLNQVIPSLSPQAIAASMLTLALFSGVLGLRVSGALQTAIAIAIVGGLLIITFGFLWTENIPVQTTIEIDYKSLNGIAVGIPIVLFAFTGWEMTAFLAEDMRNPRRDLPRSIWASFIVVVILYMLIAWTVASYAQQNQSWVNAPILEMAKIWIGEGASKVIGLIVAVLVLANVIAAFTSASRAIYSAGRDGLLPRSIGATTKAGSPLVAMLATYAAFIFVVLLTYLEGIYVATLLQLAGQNFFALYLITAIGYCSLHRKLRRRFIGYFSILSVVGAMTLFNVNGILYCCILGFIGLRLSRHHKKPIQEKFFKSAK